MTGRHAIAVDLGGTQLRAAVVDAEGRMLARSAEPARALEGPKAVVDQIAALVSKVGTATDRSNVIGAGVCSPGPIDTIRGVGLGIPTFPGFEGFPFRRALEEALGLPVALDNDGICAAIGEWRMGAGRGYDNIVYATVSTGIGGGVIAGGRVLRGHRGIAGHVGHMSIVVDGELCLCGCRGCFEAYASGSSFTARAIAVAERTPGALPSPVNAQSVFAAAREGNQVALRLIREEEHFLGQGFANLLHLYSPEVLIMGGGMSSQFDMMKDGIVARMRASSMPAYRDVPLVKAALGGDSGILGAAALVFDESLRAGHTSAP